MSFPSGKGNLNFIKSSTVNCSFVLGKVKWFVHLYTWVLQNMEKGEDKKKNHHA